MRDTDFSDARRLRPFRGEQWFLTRLKDILRARPVERTPISRGFREHVIVRHMAEAQNRDGTSSGCARKSTFVSAVVYD